MSHLGNQNPNLKWYPQQSPAWNPGASQGRVNQSGNRNTKLSVTSNPAYNAPGQVPDAMNQGTYSVGSAATTPHGRYSWMGSYSAPTLGVNQGTPSNYDRMPRAMPVGPMRYPPQQRLYDDFGCTGTTTAPLDPYICTSIDTGTQSCCESTELCCDWTFSFMFLFLLLTVAGLGVILGTYRGDALFTKLNASDGTDLDNKMAPYIKWKNRATNPGVGDGRSCTNARLAGSYGNICMEDNLNANVLVTQLSQWNNARDSLWCLAVIYTFIAIVYALFIHSHRKTAMTTGLRILEGLPPLTPEKQAELLQMTPLQQQHFIKTCQKFSVENSIHSLAQGSFRPDGRVDNCCSSKIEVYDTPFYEFMRIAWLFIGFTVLAWTVNLFISFSSFSSFYINETTGPLHDFWVGYQKRFISTLVAISVYLAWPFFNFFIELIILIVFIIPWLIIRAVCFSQIGNYRPSLSLSDLPGWIRIDMFFMDMQDIRRLGFSRQAWIILTGSEQPFCSYEDPEVDQDPNMTSLRQWRDQWYMNMYGAPPPWATSAMAQPGMPVPQSGELPSGVQGGSPPPPGIIQDAYTANSGVPIVNPGPPMPGDAAKSDSPAGGEVSPARSAEADHQPDRADAANASAAPPVESARRHHRRHHRSKSLGASPRERDFGASPHPPRRHRHHTRHSIPEPAVSEGRAAEGGARPAHASNFDRETPLRGPAEGARSSPPEATVSHWQTVQQTRLPGATNEGRRSREMELDELMKL